MGAATDFAETMKFQNIKLGEGLNGRAFPNVEFLHKVGGSPLDPDYLNAKGDYSVTPREFEISALNGSDLFITSITVFIEDAGSFDSGKYGNGITLTNGITFSLDWDGLTYFTSFPPIYKNLDFARQFNSDIKLIQFGIGNNAMTCALEFDYNKSVPVMLRANTNDRFYITLNDNFSGLEGHYFIMNGYLVNKPGKETFKDG